MQRSKRTALAVLFVVLLAGGALGFSADRVLLRDQICPRGADQRGMRERMFDDLALDSAQRVAMDAILDERQRQMKTLMAPIRPQLDSISDAAREQMLRVMNEEQRIRFEAMREEMKQKK